MLRIRIISAAAITVATMVTASVGAAGGASAQTADPNQAGRPLSRSAAAEPAANSATAVKRTRVRRLAHRRHGKTAAKQQTDRPNDPTQSNASADAWLAASAPPTSAPPATPATASPAAQAGAFAPDKAPTAASAQAQQDAASALGGSLPSAIVVGGQTVPIGTADQINAIDLAADDSPPMESTLPRGDRVDPATAGEPAASQVAFAAQASAAKDQNADDEDAVAKDASGRSAAAENSSVIGNASELLQILAALGGAVTAGMVGWFLIGAGPVRNYG
jgi:hypothetical protein